MPNTKLQMLLRGQNLLGYKHYHDDVVEKFVELSIKNGIDILRIFDALNDFRNIKTALEATKKYATKNTVASGCISYTQSPVHTVEKYIDMCKELKTMGFDTICLKDMAGTMSPYEAEHLIKGIKDAVGDMPLILHTHCTTGMAYMTVTKAIESGIDVIDCATSCFSNGTSQPATETMFYALQQYGIKTGLNEDVINKVNDFFKPVKQKYVDSGRINAEVHGDRRAGAGLQGSRRHAVQHDREPDRHEGHGQVRRCAGRDSRRPQGPRLSSAGHAAVPDGRQPGRYQRPAWRALQAGLQGSQELLQGRVRHRARARLRGASRRKILGEGGKPVDCRIEDAKRTGEEFKAAKEALGELARSEEDVMSYICYPDQAMKFFDRPQGQGREHLQVLDRRSVRRLSAMFLVNSSYG